MIEGITLGIALLALVVAVAKRDSSGYPPGAVWPTVPPSKKEILEELEAKEKLEKKYRWVIPRHNMYLGKKYLDKEVTQEMKESINFLPRESLGRWVKK